MPSPEHFYERRPQETPTTSRRMQAVITDLAAYYEVDLDQEGARFNFTRPEHDKQWVIANLDGSNLDVARCPVAADDFMVPDIDVVLAMTPTGWQTMSVVHTDAVWEAFAKVAAEKGQLPEDPQTNFPFSPFTEYVAQLIAEEIRLEQAREAAEVKTQLNLE